MAIVSVIAITIALVLGPGIVSSFGASSSPLMACYSSGSRALAGHRVSIPWTEPRVRAELAVFRNFIRHRLAKGQVGSGVWPGPPLPIAWKCTRMG